MKKQVSWKNKFSQTEIFINLIHEGLHCWPNAFKEVEFLQNKHRHNFHIHMRKRVYHDDRDVEFIHWKHQVQKYLASLPYDLGSTSCEMLARDLFNRFDCTFVSVSEDGEAGAQVSEDFEYQNSLAWLAGIIDGEGHLGINRRNAKNINKFVYGITVFVGNTDKDMIDRVAAILSKMGINRCPTIYQSKIKAWNTMYNLSVTRRSEVVKLLEEIYPYLITKKHRANLLLRWCKSRLEQEAKEPNHAKLNWSEEENLIYEEMKRLNKRGKKEPQS